MPESIFKTWENNDESNRGKTSEEDFSLRDANIWGHTHRMYLIGYNSAGFPWFIPKDFPRDALKKGDREKFLKFIDAFNPKLRWTWVERLGFAACKLIYPPLAKSAHTWVRKRKFNILQRELYRTFPPQFWGDKGDNKSLRLGYTGANYNLAYIDFIDYSIHQDSWPGLKLPMSILVSGAGTFNNPYFLDFKKDSFVKSLALIDLEFFQDKLHLFLENFNSQLAKLNFYKLEPVVMSDLSKVVRWLETANTVMFHHFGVKCVLYIVENQYTEIDVGVFKQKRRSFPLETLFFDAFPEMYQRFLAYVKGRLHSKKSELRLLLQFKKYSKLKAIKTGMRVK